MSDPRNPFDSSPDFGRPFTNPMDDFRARELREMERNAFVKESSRRVRDTGNQAAVFYENFERGIKGMSKDLKEGEQVVITFHTPAGQIMAVESFGYHNPTMILLNCIDSKGGKSKVFAHVNTVQLMAQIVKPEDNETYKTKSIGFIGDTSKKENLNANNNT